MNEISHMQGEEVQLSPQNIEAEQQLLGALLVNNDNFDKVSDILVADHFFEPLHGKIYEIIQKRIVAGIVASPVTLKAHLEHNNALNDLGGVSYLVRLAGASISSFACRDYATIIIEEHTKRGIVEAAESACYEIRQGDQPAAEVANRLEDEVGRISANTTTKPLIRSFLSASTGAIEQINDAYQGVHQVGIDTGIASLDRMLGRLRPGTSTILAGRPSMGKTTVAHNIALNVARRNQGVFFASLEMPSEDLSMRAFSHLLAVRGEEIEYSKIIHGNLTENQFRGLIEVAQEHQSLPFVTGERECRDIGRFRAAARRAQQQMADTPCPLKLVVIDYVQMLNDPKARSSYDRVSAASDAVKSLAMDLGVPVVGLSQLSRQVEQRVPQIPNLGDLRESGKLEEDADNVILVYRPAYYLQKVLDADNGDDVSKTADLTDALESCRNDVDLIIAKQRNGATGSATSRFYAGLNYLGTIGSKDQKGFDL